MIGSILEDDSSPVRAIAAPAGIAGEVEIVSGTEVSLVAVAVDPVAPAPSAAEGAPAGAAPAATVHVAPPAWAHLGAADRGAAVAVVDGADDVSAYMAIRRSQ